MTKTLFSHNVTVNEKLVKSSWSLFVDGVNFLKATEPQRGDSLLSTTKSPGVAGTQFIVLETMKG